MCANCGFPAAQGHWTDAGAASAFDRIRGRLQRARILAPVLASYGLTVHDDGSGSGFTSGQPDWPSGDGQQSERALGGGRAYHRPPCRSARPRFVDEAPTP